MVRVGRAILLREVRVGLEDRVGLPPEGREGLKVRVAPEALLRVREVREVRDSQESMAPVVRVGRDQSQRKSQN